MQIRQPQRDEEAGLLASGAQHQPKLTSHLLQGGAEEDQVVLGSADPFRVQIHCRAVAEEWSPSLWGGEARQHGHVLCSAH